MQQWKPRWVRRTGAGLAAAAVAAAVALAPAAPAAAHVTAHAEEAVPGESARVVFRVPNESDANVTVGLEVHLLPSGAPPIPSVLTSPVPGWSAEVESETLDEPVAGPHGEGITEAASVVTWTADSPDEGIQPGEFGEFPVEIGPLPDAELLYFPTFQHYDGLDEPVEWIEQPDPDGAEPPSPAPLLRLAQSGEAGTDGGSETPPEQPSVEQGEDDAAAGDAAGGDDEGGSGALWLAVAGLVAGLGGLVLGGLAFTRTRRA